MAQALTGLTGLSGIVAGGNQVTTLVNDTFTDANGTNLTAHVPDIRPAANPSWVAVAGTITVQTNQAKNTGAVDSFYTIDAGQADVTITVDIVTSGAGNGYGVEARRSDGNNGWNIGVDEAGNRFVIYEDNAGVYTLRASASQTITDGTTYTIKAVLSGTTITGTINGGNQISYTSATLNQTTTKHGISLKVNWTADNFKVTAP